MILKIPSSAKRSIHPLQSALQRRAPPPGVVLAAGLGLVALLTSGCGEGVRSGASLQQAAPPARSSLPAPAPSDTARAPVADAFVGSEACRDCHQDEWEAWQGSHHQLAMQRATPATVLGAFDGSVLDHHGEIIRFAGGPDTPTLETVEPGGAPTRWPVTHVFGITPLQQYLARFPGGRYQVTTAAWDTRDAAQGGQRWFHIYPQAPTPPGHPTHWQGELQNWNSQCAECHVTGLRKGYNWRDDTYETRYAELGVGCEGCHGRGARHVDWARQPPGAAERYPERGLELTLGDTRRWVHGDDSGIAVREPPLRHNRQPEACGRCHARRGTYTDDYRYGQPLLETHRPAVIEPDLYFPDGQIRDEVYVYGSFLQSKMYQAGVTCTDCHDPHTARLKAQGDAVCAGCHRPDVFAVEAHSRHPTGATACVDCHMGERRYMVVDGRRDHSFRVPRPDLSVALATPNVCTGCHADRTDDWAARAVARWYPGGRHTRSHFGALLAQAWAGRADALPGLARLVEERQRPAIVRASALQAMRGLPLGDAELAVIERALDDVEPLLRFSALEVLSALPPRVAVPLALPRLEDSVRGVRMPAAAVVAPADGRLPRGEQQAFERAAAELTAAARYQFDRLAGRGRYASFLAARGRLGEAEGVLRQALERYPEAPALSVNLADVLRRQGRDGEGVAILAPVARRHPTDPAVREALALAYVRADRHADAVTELRALVSLQPESPRAGVLLVLALDRVGEHAEAAERLAQLRNRFPADAMVSAVRLSGRGG